MTKIEVTRADMVAAEEIGGYIATWHEFNSRSAYEEGCHAAAKFRIAVTAQKDAEIARLKSAVINLIGALEMENPLPWRGTINEAENSLGEKK